MISPPSKEQFNSRPEDSWPLFSLEFFWHGSLTELRVSDFSPETHRFIQLSAAAVTIKPFIFSFQIRKQICPSVQFAVLCSICIGEIYLKSQCFTKLSVCLRGPLKVFH
ncbi:hypothetical protein AN641_00430 [Candidatus Epulonipiscioides gigas]|nr:hypothetical protein AN641_00430 [Epulopiscium sp. SCG-C07WGA-EpuloA2]